MHKFGKLSVLFGSKQAYQFIRILYPLIAAFNEDFDIVCFIFMDIKGTRITQKNAEAI